MDEGVQNTPCPWSLLAPEKQHHFSQRFNQNPIQTLLNHGYSFTRDTDQLTSRPFKDKSGKQALNKKKEVLSQCFLQLLSNLQNALITTAPLTPAMWLERQDRLGVGATSILPITTLPLFPFQSNFCSQNTNSTREQYTDHLESR